MAWAASQADIDGMARLTFTVGETGVLVTGEQSAVSAYTAQLGNLARMGGQPVTVFRSGRRRGSLRRSDQLRGVIGIVRSALPAKHGAAQAAPDDPRPDRKVLPGCGPLGTGQVADAGAQERARQLRNLLDSGQIGLMLQLSYSLRIPTTSGNGYGLSAYVSSSQIIWRAS